MHSQQLLLGVVEDIQGPEIRINVGNLMPRYLPLKDAVFKHGKRPELGEVLLLVVNDQNAVIEYHAYGENRRHFLVNGKLLYPLTDEHQFVVIQYLNGRIKTTPVDPEARVKLLAVPVGEVALFLLDDSHKIIDVTF